MLKKTLQGPATDRYGYQKPISVTSLRHRQIAGEHTVILCGDHEQITITHMADSREIFCARNSGSRGGDSLFETRPVFDGRLACPALFAAPAALISITPVPQSGSS